MSDYYSVLGVSRDSSEADIKKAYRQLARKLHPDIAGHSKENEDQFKEVQNAYEVLSNPEKRQMYDMGHDPLKPNSGGGNPFDFGANFGFNSSSIFNDIFDMFGGNAGGSSRARRASNQGQDVLKRVKITLREAIFGCDKTLAINLAIGCDKCESTGSNTKSSSNTCSTCHGQGIVLQVQNTMFGQMQSQTTCPDCRGQGVKIADPCDVCNGQGIVTSREKIEITIPKGVRTGNRIVLDGKGNKGVNGGIPGDLYIEIKVNDDDVFNINGNDLVCKLEVPLTIALLGGDVSVATFDGEQQITIDPNTNFGAVKRISRLGFPTNVRSDVRGDIRVFIEVIVPSKLNKSERELVAKLSDSLKDRKHKYQLQNIEDGGFFNRLKKMFS